MVKNIFLLYFHYLFSQRVRKVEDEEKNQFAVHNNIMYWFRDTDSAILYCNASRSDCEKSQKSYDLRLSSALWTFTRV